MPATERNYLELRAAGVAVRCDNYAASAREKAEAVGKCVRF
jgi:hypothetical protein